MASAISLFCLNILEDSAFSITARRKCDEGDSIRRREYLCCDGFSDPQPGAALLPERRRLRLFIRFAILSPPCPAWTPLRAARTLCIAGTLFGARKVFRAPTPLHALELQQPASPADRKPKLQLRFAPWRRCPTVALVRLVDAHPEGRRPRTQPRRQLAALGASQRPARRRRRGMVPSCRHDHRPHRGRRMDRQVRQ
jgi:hypothetical protein